MTTPSVILCPGQGAQFVGMARAWRDAFPAAIETFHAAERVIGSRLPAPLSELCVKGPAELLNRTDVAQPAIFTASVACFRAGFGSAVPAALAGLSLGEYTALHLAGAVEFEHALELVVLRGRAMQDTAEASRGSMVALIGADEAQAQAVCDAASHGGVLVPANYNAPGQIVLSGDASACDRAVIAAESMGLKPSRFPVAGAFHSPLMAPAAERLRSALERTPIQAPRGVVVSNVTAQPHVPDPTSIRARLVEQLTSPVKWSQSCAWLARSYPSPGHAYHELAPGKVLSGLMRRIDRAVKVTNHDEPAPAPAAPGTA